MADYNYSLSGDFSNGIDLNCLHKTIEAYGFATPFNGIILEGDDITVMFTGSLGTVDQSNLDTIVANHDPENCGEESDIGNVIGAAGDVESLEQSSTTSKSPQQKLRMAMEDLPEGRYRIGWYYEWFQSSQATDFRARVQLNDSIDLMYHSQEAAQSGNTQSHPSCGFSYQTLTEGSHYIDLDFWAENNTSYIKNARLEIWKVE